MIFSVLFACLVAYASAASVSFQNTWTYTGSTQVTSGTGSTTSYGWGKVNNPSPNVFTGSTGTKWQWSPTMIITNSASHFGYGSVLMTPSGSTTSYYTFCNSGAFSPSSSWNSWTTSGNIWHHTFTAAGTGTATGSSNFNGRYYGYDQSTSITLSASPSGNPTMCGSVVYQSPVSTITSSGFAATGQFQASGLLYFGSTTSSASFLVYGKTSGSYRYVTGIGSYRYGTQVMPIGFRYVDISGSAWTGYGHVAGLPFTATGNYYFGGSTSAYWYVSGGSISTTSVPSTSSSAFYAYGSLTSSGSLFASASSTLQTITGYITDHNSVYTGSGLQLKVSAYGGRWEASVVGLTQYTSSEAIRGTYSASSGTYTFAATSGATFHGLTVTASGSFGPGGAWYITSGGFSCTAPTSVSTCSTTSCTTPAFVSGGKMLGCGAADRTAGTFTGTGLYQNYLFTLTGYMAVGSGTSLSGIVSVANLEIPIKGTLTSGHIFVLSGSGQGNINFSANGFMMGNTWAITSGSFK